MSHIVTKELFWLWNQAPERIKAMVLKDTNTPYNFCFIFTSMVLKVLKSQLNINCDWAVVVEKLVEQWLPTLEDPGSNRAISNF